MKDRRINIPFAAIFLLAAFFIFYNIHEGSLVNSDDSIYAEIVKQILKRGEWLKLYWQDFDYFTKPPLFFWMGALSAKIFGLNEFALRLPAALSGFLTVLLVFSFARRLSGDSGAFLASTTLLGFQLFLNLSHRVMLDVPLVFFITASIYGFYRGVDEGRYLYLGWISAGLAFLVKGLAFWPALAVPFTYYFVFRRFSIFKKREFLTGFASFTVLFFPWQLYNILSPKGGVFISRFFSGQVIRHYLGQGAYIFNRPFLFYIRDFFALDHGIFALTVISIVLLAVFYKRAEFTRISMLLIWILIYFAVYSFSRSKLDHYMLGMYPPLAVIIGYVFSGRLFSSRVTMALAGLLVIIIASLNFIPYLNAQGWHVDSSREIKTLVRKYNLLYQGKERLYTYSIYIPAPVFYSKGEVTGVEPTDRLFKIYTGVAEFKGKVLKLDDKGLCRKMKDGHPYAIIKDPDFSSLAKSCRGLKVVEKYKKYSLISN